MWSAIYHDGLQAAGRQVEVSINDEGLAIEVENSGLLARWQFDDIHLVANSDSDGVVRLRCGFEGYERLTLADAAILVPLAAHCPNLHRTTPGWRTTIRSTMLWMAAAIVSLALLFKVVIRAMATQFAAILPHSWEQRMGERLAEQIVVTLSQIERNSAVEGSCRSAVARLALDGLAERLTENVVPALQITLRVVDLNAANALALPGGQILIFRGLLDFAEHGDELSGVLAHEIGHVMLRHPLEVAIKGASVSILVSLIVGDITGGTAIAGVGAALLAAAYTQSAERDADALGIGLLNDAGFDSRRVADLFERFGRRAHELEGALSHLSSHPQSQERAEAARAKARAGRPAFEPKSWQAIRTMCD